MTILTYPAILEIGIVATVYRENFGGLNIIASLTQQNDPQKMGVLFGTKIEFSGGSRFHPTGAIERVHARSPARRPRCF
jgi:hypothetical protein